MSDHEGTSRGFGFYAPFILTALLLAADQITKALVIAGIPEGRIAWSWGGDFFWLVHARNLGIAFSIGDELGMGLRRALFIALPAILITGALVYYFKGKGITKFQHWLLAILVAGGLGNLIDRVFRPDGVVDFLSFKFFGIFGLERWPTFNIADMCVLCSAILLALTSFSSEGDKAGPGKPAKGKKK
ncbi:MAG: signal peptidase II [Rectinemataceae bacterium]